MAMKLTLGKPPLRISGTSAARKYLLYPTQPCGRQGMPSAEMDLGREMLLSVGDMAL